MTNQCDATTTVMFENTVICCGREFDHLGRHQSLADNTLYTWSSGGRSERVLSEKTILKNCEECKVQFVVGDYVNQREGVCQECNFWFDLLTRYDEDERAVINGEHYIVGPVFSSIEKDHMLGFGGSSFHIRFNDGRNILTSNLWHQGTIPQLFRPMIPDNAVFVVRESV